MDQYMALKRLTESRRRWLCPSKVRKYSRVHPGQLHSHDRSSAERERSMLTHVAHVISKTSSTTYPAFQFSMRNVSEPDRMN
ncbi:unnamed protein product [Sphenostylis stenocarpa]|uniref:Uncharacterized protein n=1 Tax=Sphenostylis stenocarpa TaxID=92480 RepID=A0AA86S7I4_9FABA|nr:unnamed protein product [Sphenostylis stenocarpa]